MTPEEAARFEALERHVAELTARIARLEGGRVREAPRTVERVREMAATAPAAEVPIVSMPQPPPRTATLETAVGLTWISRIAVITVVLALAFFFEYAFQNHWISESGRVLLGIGCGAAALASGEWFSRKGQRAYAQSLTAAGLGFLYLSLWAAFALYHLISQPVAFAAMLATTAGAGALALRYDAPAVAMLGLAGGYATPLLLAAARSSWFVLAYALILDGGAAFAVRVRRWRWLEWLALAGTVVLYGAQAPIPFGTPFLLLFYVLFAASEDMWIVSAAQVLASVALVLVWPEEIGLLITGAVAAAGLGVADRRGWRLPVPAAFAGYWLAYLIWSGESAPRTLTLTLALLTAGFLLFLAWPMWRVLARRQVLRFEDLLVTALNTACYFGSCYALLAPDFGAFEGLFAVVLAIVQMAVARALWERDPRGSLLAAGVAWVLLVLAAPIQFAGYHITIAWAAEAAAVVWISTRFREMRAVYAASTVFLLVFLRLLFIDSRMFTSAGSYEALFNARFLTFAIAAGALWASAWWIRDGRMAFAAFAGGHAVMLWGLSLEAVGWAMRMADPQNVQSVASTSISVLVAAYAVLLVAAGAARHSAVTRIMGIVLIGFVVLKLYLYDVWLLGQFYRMAAFAILGVLLLTMSYVYSRRKA